MPTLPSWQLVLMPCEWTPASLVTRDDCNFAVPHAVEAMAVPLVAAPVAARVDEAPAVEARAAPAAAPARSKATAPQAPAKAKVSEKSTKVEALPSVNTASADELAAVKGLSKTVAKAIVAGRPYASLDELTRAKGMGEKLLARVRQQLSL